MLVVERKVNGSMTAEGFAKQEKREASLNTYVGILRGKLNVDRKMLLSARKWLGPNVGAVGTVARNFVEVSAFEERRIDREEWEVSMGWWDGQPL